MSLFILQTVQKFGEAAGDALKLVFFFSFLYILEMFSFVKEKK